MAWIVAIAGSLLGVLRSPQDPSGAFFVMLIFGPTALGLAIIFVVGLRPRGPVMRMEYDVRDALNPDTHFSVVSGKVRFGSPIRSLEVAIAVPTVFGVASSLLDSSAADTDGIAEPETSDWALQFLRVSYPDATWEQDPDIRPASTEEARFARSRLLEKVGELPHQDA